MNKISQKIDQARIEAAILTAEKDSQVEIVPVIARASSDYGRENAFFAFTLSLLLLAASWILFQDIGPDSNWGGYTVPKLGLWMVLGILVAGFIFGLLLTRWIPALDLLYTTRARRQQQVERRAREQFQRLRIRRTDNAVGVLIYISLLERMVHIVSDDRINAIIGADGWQLIVDQVTTELKMGQINEALEVAISQIGVTVMPHLPVSGDNLDELPNRVYFV